MWTRAAFWARFNHAAVYRTTVGERVIAGLYAINLPVSFVGRQLAMRGIGVVMSDPVFRGQGGPSKLMRQALVEMDAAQVELSYLAPFSYTFYRRFGYEQVFNRTTTTFKRQELVAPDLSSDVQFSTASFAAVVEKLQAFYAARVQDLRGGLVRDDWWWDYLVTRYNERQVLLCQGADGGLLGYTLYVETPNEIQVVERVAVNAQVSNTLLVYLNNQLDEGQQLSVVTPNSMYFGLELPEPDLATTAVTPYMMARIVNIQSFVRQYPFSADFAEINIKLTDPVIERNNGVWRFTPGSLTKAPAQQRPDLEISITRFSQLMLGAVTLQQLIDWQQVIVNDDKRAQQFALTLVQTEPELVDYF